VKKEVAIFEVEGKSGANLESCYENFYSLLPSSVNPERVFSGCGRTVTKIRSSLHDESVDARLDQEPAANVIGRKRPERLTKTMVNTSRYLRMNRRWETKKDMLSSKKITRSRK
jgi:hypothetical protein